MVDDNDTQNNITAIDSEEYDSTLVRMSLQIPAALIQMFNEDDEMEVRIIAALLYNVDDLFPSGRRGFENA